MTAPEQVSFAVLTEALAKELGFPEAVSEEEDFFHFEKDGIPVTIFRKGTKVMFYSAVGVMPADPEKRAGLSAVLLNANALYRETGEAALGVLAEEDIVTLCWLAPLDGLSVGEFLVSVENYLLLAEQWAKRIAEYTPPGEENAVRAVSGLSTGLPQHGSFAGIPDFA
jgi:hypothetical protein